MRGRRAVVAALVTLLAGCGGAGRTVVTSPDQLEGSSGRPSISRITDLGAIAVPASGEVRISDSDGVGTVGELLLVEGSDIGRLPAIRIAGRPAKVLARLANGGIVARVPAGVPTGTQPIEVSNPNGKTRRDFTIRRQALVLETAAGRVHVVDLDHPAAPRKAPLAIENPRAVRFSTDGSVAYVASGVGGSSRGGRPGRVTVIGMSGRGGPRIIGKVGLASRLTVALASADAAPIIAVVGETEVTFMQVDNPESPNPFQPWRLPDEAVRAGVVAAELSPDGKLLALLLGESNRLLSVDVSNPAAPKEITTIDLIPDARAPLVRDMQFAIDGQTLWIVSGDNAQSLRIGKHPTRLTAVRLGPSQKTGEAASVAVWRTSVIPGAGAPLRLSVVRGQMLASGTTIRTAPDSASVFVTGVQGSLFELGRLELHTDQGRASAGKLLGAVRDPGQILKTDVDGGGGPLLSLAEVVSSLDVSPDAQTLIALAARAAPASAGAAASPLTFELGLVVTPIWGQRRTVDFVSLGRLGLDAVRPPFNFGAVRMQP